MNVKWGFCIEWRHPCICMGKYDVTHDNVWRRGLRPVVQFNEFIFRSWDFPVSLYLETGVLQLKSIFESWDFRTKQNKN